MQIADVSVDIETGVVTMNEMVAVQDCGLIINLKLAESQVYGALIMGVTYALFEEAVYDPQTGAMLNPDMEFYRLARLPDVGKLRVHMMTGKGYDERGVIGLGEPPVISPALQSPTPWPTRSACACRPCRSRPIACSLLSRKEGRRMKSFEYASPTDLESAIGLLGSTFGEAEILAGGTDLVTSLKQGIVSPKRVVSLKAVPKLKGIDGRREQDLVGIGAMTPLVDVARERRDPQELSHRSSRRSRASAARKSSPWAPSAATSASGRAAGIIGRASACLGQLDGKSLIPEGDNRYHAIFGNDGPAYFVNASSLAPALIALGATLEIVGPKGKAKQTPVAEFLSRAQKR